MQVLRVFDLGSLEMKQIIWFIFLLMISTPSCAHALKPGVAGDFYPADRGELVSQVNSFLTNVPAQEISGDIIALIVPHAGYPFSGQVAAYAYKQLEGRSYDRVILIGTSHKMTFDDIAVPGYDQFETPLGSVQVDKDFIDQLIKRGNNVKINNAPFDMADNSLEVQLPFLQAVQKKARIVPIFFGNISIANCRSLAYALDLLVDDRTLIIASSDLSHYFPYDTANKMDSSGIGKIVSGDLAGLIKALSKGETEACGVPAVITAALLAPALGANKTVLLKYANSGDVTGDKSRVVGYAAIAFINQEIKLTDHDKKRLLKIARRTLLDHLAGKKLPVFTPKEPSLNEKRGVFVTLTEDGKLRGCIGYIEPVRPLFSAVQGMAVNAASNDPRFRPVTSDEAKNIVIEISALSRLRRIKDISEIKIGQDGLYIIKGESSGLLLPQVATEFGLDRDQFLKQVCIKAGLPENAWQDKDAVLYRFSADVFHEQKRE